MNKEPIALGTLPRSTLGVKVPAIAYMTARQCYSQKKERASRICTNLLTLTTCVAVLSCSRVALSMPATEAAVQVVAPNVLNETAQGQSVQIGVNYWEPGYTGTITSRVEVAERHAEAGNPATLKLDSAYASKLPGEENVYYVPLSNSTPVSVAIESIDGTSYSSFRGFTMTVSIIASNVDYTQWRGVIYVNNVTPVCVVTPENDDYPWKVAIGGSSPTSIHWQVVSDAKGDFDGISSFPGVKVSFRGCLNGESFYVTEPSSGTFIPDFGTLMGSQLVTLTIEDKDGGQESWCYNYEIGYPEETINGITWIYDIAGGHATVLEVEDCTESEILIPSSLGDCPVTSIGYGAFSDCSWLMSVTIPDSVKSIDYFAFSCDNLTNITFTGNAPYVDDDAFHVNSDCVIYVPRGSTGWSVEIPGTWNGIRIEYLAEESQTHTITFSLGEHGIRTGGGGLSQIVTNGWSATAPEVVATNGWAFTGWSEIFTNVTTSLTVTAQYEKLPEKVDYYVSGGGYVLQHVIDIAENGSTILVGDGMYAPIDTADKTLTIRSVNGADETIINGHFDGKTWRRCALLGIIMDNNGVVYDEDDFSGGNLFYRWVESHGVVLEGFMLLNGSAWIGGGVAGGVIRDCTVDNCCAYLGGGAFDSTLMRCKVVNCSAYGEPGNNEGMGGGAFNSELYNSLVTSCIADGDAGGLHACDVYFCTIVDNILHPAIGSCNFATNNPWFGGCSAGVNFCNVSNSIIWANFIYGALFTNDWTPIVDVWGNQVYGYGTINCSIICEEDDPHAFFCNNCTDKVPDDLRDYYGATVENNIVGNPMFIGETAGDYHLLENSPCIDKAVMSTSIGSTDLGGMPRLSGIAPDIGAYEYQYVVDLFPELSVDATHEEVSAALSGVLDADIVENITNAMQYAAYRSWALAITNDIVTAQSVKDSTRAWLSFALGADALIGKEIASEDVSIVAFTVGDSGTSMSFEVKIDGVNIGEGTVAEETLKTNLKKVLGLEGAATLDKNAFTPDGIEITFDMPKDGKAKFVATPPTGADTSFFMRVKVK